MIPLLISAGPASCTYSAADSNLIPTIMTRHPQLLRHGPGYRVHLPLQAPPLYPEETQPPIPNTTTTLPYARRTPPLLTPWPTAPESSQPIAGPSRRLPPQHNKPPGLHHFASARTPPHTALADIAGSNERGTPTPAYAFPDDIRRHSLPARPTTHVYLPPIATTPPPAPLNGGPISPISGVALRPDRAKPYDRSPPAHTPQSPHSPTLRAPRMHSPTQHTTVHRPVAQHTRRYSTGHSAPRELRPTNLAHDVQFSVNGPPRVPQARIEPHRNGGRKVKSEVW
jgi:hypothetical protein